MDRSFGRLVVGASILVAGGVASACGSNTGEGTGREASALIGGGSGDDEGTPHAVPHPSTCSIGTVRSCQTSPCSCVGGDGVLDISQVTGPLADDPTAIRCTILTAPGNFTVPGPGEVGTQPLPAEAFDYPAELVGRNCTKTAVLAEMFGGRVWLCPNYGDGGTSNLQGLTLSRWLVQDMEQIPQVSSGLGTSSSESAMDYYRNCLGAADANWSWVVEVSASPSSGDIGGPCSGGCYLIP